MATYTENLGLEKPDLDDFYDVTKRNNNYDIIDEAIGNLDDDMKDHKTDPDAHSEVFNNYVKKSGDTMSGNLSKSVNNSSFELYGGSGWANGALLKLNGKENTEKGSFNLTAHNGSEFTELKGTANGSLTWKNKNIVRSVNGVNADDNGNVILASGYPSDRYIELSMGNPTPMGDGYNLYRVAYTAPENGYFCLQTESFENKNCELRMTNIDRQWRNPVPYLNSSTARLVSIYAPYKKGQTCTIYASYIDINRTHLVFCYGEN